jgi:hypothetical protein
MIYDVRAGLFNRIKDMAEFPDITPNPCDFVGYIAQTARTVWTVMKNGDWVGVVVKQ